jgi:hypothetical protein
VLFLSEFLYNSVEDYILYTLYGGNKEMSINDYLDEGYKRDRIPNVVPLEKEPSTTHYTDAHAVRLRQWREDSYHILKVVHGAEKAKDMVDRLKPTESYMQCYGGGSPLGPGFR